MLMALLCCTKSEDKKLVLPGQVYTYNGATFRVQSVKGSTANLNLEADGYTIPWTETVENLQKFYTLEPAGAIE